MRKNKIESMNHVLRFVDKCERQCPNKKGVALLYIWILFSRSQLIITSFTFHAFGESSKQYKNVENFGITNHNFQYFNIIKWFIIVYKNQVWYS